MHLFFRGQQGRPVRDKLGHHPGDIISGRSLDILVIRVGIGDGGIIVPTPLMLKDLLVNLLRKKVREFIILHLQFKILKKILKV